MINFIKNLFGISKPQPEPTKISEHIAKKETQKKATAKKVPSKAELKKLTKVKLEEMGRENGIELDRRLTKDKLVNALHKHLKGN